MIEEKDGWYVVNMRDCRWFGNRAFGMTCEFEREGERFPQTGVRVFVVSPGKPMCHYHREDAQEDFLVLSGKAKLLANGEERDLEAWDFVHCPAGATHVIVGAGDGPAAILAIGHRPESGMPALYYPKSELAARYGAETPEATSSPAVAYAEVDRRAPVDPPRWPLED